MPVPAGTPAKIAPPNVRALGVFKYGNKIYLPLQSPHANDEFCLAVSDDGLNFEKIDCSASLLSKDGAKIDLTHASLFRFSQTDHEFIATFQTPNGAACLAHLAKMTNLLEWLDQPGLTGLECPAMVLPATRSNGDYVAYCGEGNIKIAFSENLLDWQIQPEPLLSPRPDHFDSGQLTLESVLPTATGLLLLYQSLVGNQPHVGAAIFDRADPDVLLWRSPDSLWKPLPQWQAGDLRYIGTVEKDGRLISYWHLVGEGLYAVTYLLHQNDISVQSKNITLTLNKAKTNPLIAPKSANTWEAFTTFNPAAIYEGGKVHILYRAQGHDYVSSVGYASSSDGLTIDQRHEQPCYIPMEKFEESNGPPVIAFMSGGGFGGCEDPRLTRIGDRIYMTYVAFNGYSEPRIALTSISVTDFLDHRWFWEKPVLISPPGVIDKSAVIFPEKIGGKYVILHRVFPDILLDFVDSLEFDGSTWLKGEYRITTRPDHWDSRKIGAGAPPLKTADGWLLIYYSVDERDDRRYKIGAMLLDLDDPRKVLYRTNNPILEPNERYENEGFKAGVAYPCGAVIIDGTLFVYYGAADTVVCVATAPLQKFINDLKHSHLAKLDPAHIKKIH